MQADIPAAHSMDSTWFAVDEDGHIAVFDTGEGGPIPDSGFPAGGEAGVGEHLEEGEVFAALVLLRALDTPKLRAVLPEEPEEAAALLAEAWWEMDGDGARLLGSVGAFRFFGDYGGVPYERENSVGTAVSVDQLPEPLRGRLESARLPVRFSQLRLLAPGEYVRVQSWSGSWVDTDGQQHDANQPPTGHPPGADDGVREEHEFDQPLPIDEVIELVTTMVELALEDREHQAARAAERAEARGGGLFGWLKSLFGG